MKIALTILGLTLASVIHVSAQNDILNFSNNDTLHGTFLGFSNAETLLWQSNQTDDPIHFSTKKIRKIVFQKGEPRQPFTHEASVILSNGDRIPCSIVEANTNQFTIHTDFAGTLTTPHKNVLSGHLSPLSNKLLYKGPYQEDQWSQFDFSRKTQEEEQKEQTPAWEFGNFSWLNNGKAGALVLNNVELPESTTVQFKVESPMYTDLTLVLYADFIQPEQKEKDEKTRHVSSYAHITKHFGTCLALKVHSSTASLSLNTFSEDGETAHTNIRPISSRGGYSYRRNDYDSQSTIEIRSDLRRKIIAVYRNDQLMSQWDLSTIEKLPNGKGIGFCNFSQGRNYLTRLSDIAIAPWSGVMDSAMSLTSDTNDMILLNNGLDRFSGDIASISTSEVELTGQYGKMQIPLTDVDSFYFKLDHNEKISQREKGAAVIEFHSNGKITAKPIGQKKDAILVEHPILGAMSIEYKYISSISYDETITILDKWNSQLRLK